MYSKLTGEFCLKSLEKAEKDLNTSKSVIIEGWANKAVVDRGNDLIPPEAWKTAEFERNPILFFNHDRNIPIGKALEVKVTSEGLKIKAKISKSKAAPMPYIRDMIREKVLRTFSVGFDPMGSEEKRDDGVNVIKQANLLEVSVVSIPMNQESDFSLSKSMTKQWKTKDYDGAVADVFVQRGNEVLAKLHEIISSRKNSVHGFDRTEVLEQIAGKMGIEYVNIESILSGQADITEDFLKAFSNVLMVPESMLKGDDMDDDKEMEEDDEEKGMDEDEDKEGSDEDEKMGDEDEDDKEKMEDEDEEKSAAGLDTAKDETEFGNPHLTIAKSHLALAGSMVDKLCSMDATMREMNELMKELLYGKKQDEEIMPVDEDEAEEQAEEVAEEAPEGDNGGDEDSSSDDEAEPEPEPEADEAEPEEDDSEDEEERQKVIQLVRLKRKARIVADFEKRLESL